MHGQGVEGHIFRPLRCRTMVRKASSMSNSDISPQLAVHNLMKVVDKHLHYIQH